MIVYRLDSVIKQVCPINGVSIGVVGDASSVRIDYSPSATPEQISSAQLVLANFDWSDAAQKSWEDAQAKTQAANTAVKATDPISTAARADSVLTHTYLNDIREIIAAILALMGKSTDDLKAQILANRVGKTFEETATDPAVMMSDLTRIAESVIVNRLHTAIQAGYGDPI